MKKYDVTIKGISPVIWNVMQRKLELEKAALKKNELNEWEEKNWRRKAEFDSKGKVIIPNRWLKSCMIESCKKNRIVPHYANRKTESYTFYVQSFHVENNGKSLCSPKDLEQYGAYVGGQGKNSSTKVWRVRPMVREWGADFTIIDPAGRMLKKELREILDFAGMFCGLGDSRYDNFGRFEVVKLVEAK